MTATELNVRYRNLLIVLSKEVGYLQADVDGIKVELEKEKSKGRQIGLRTVIKARKKHQAKIVLLLGRNKAASMHLFGTSDIKKIAEQEILLHP